MRVTAETKAATRRKILEVARRLFAEPGYDLTTTRDIARAAGIASGTLFNYFATKEAVVACLVTEALADERPDGRSAGSLEEEFFALIAAGLRKMSPLRRAMPALLETSLSPLAAARDDGPASLRTAHLEAVEAAAARHGFADLPATALQLYWTLYTGILAFWAADDSPRQEETLALIDDSLNMFGGWLRAQARADAVPPRNDP